jgi:hypothetical protein
MTAHSQDERSFAMRAVITGATGFIGRQLVKRIEQPCVLSRNAHAARAQLGVEEVYSWDPMAGPPPEAPFAGASAVFHLAGDSIAQGRWTKAKKARIRESRIVGTRHLVQRLEAMPDRPPTLVSTSAVGFYGCQGDTELDESSVPIPDFLTEVCDGWEAEARRLERWKVRVVLPRLGIVLGRGGGALASMLTPFKLGVGGRIGNGRQWMPWVHVDDVIGILLWAASNEALSGPINVTAPRPVTNREFTTALAKALRRPALLPAPRLGLRLILGEFANFLTCSQRVIPKRALEAGYEFRFPELEGCLADILRKGEAPQGTER